MLNAVLVGWEDDCCVPHWSIRSCIPTGLLELSQQYTEWALKKKVEHLIKKGLSTDNVAGLYGVATKFDAKVFIPYSGKLLREKTFTNFAVLWLFVKVFSVEFGGVVSFGTAKGSNPQKFSPQKIVFFTNSRKFSPWNVSHYMYNMVLCAVLGVLNHCTAL